MKRANSVFLILWLIVGLFLLSVFALLIASFTTHPTEFAGQVDLHLKFEDSQHRSVKVALTDEADHLFAPDASGLVTLHPKFAMRDSNVFDQILGGPAPRASMLTFFEAGHKRHEMTITYDRHDKAWRCELSFPDQTISQVEIENSTLVFEGLEGLRRRYKSTVNAIAIIGPPVGSGD